MKISTFKRWSEVYFLVLICVLAIGIPLVFTSLTRSVFEVNKLMLLRIVTILVCSGWIFKSLVLNANHVDDPEDGGPSYQIFGIKWRKIGLEIPLLIFLIFNILSTVFSQNIRLSVIGAYDRWEGILTALNYLVLMVMTAKLITKRYQLIILVVALVLPTAGSAVYGVFQSLGIDFMNWSVDPTKRVFACINNPVHFCAYMGMMVPLSLASLLAVSGSKFDFRGKGVVKWALFGLTGLIFYAQYLSFSRATWFGFSLAVPVFFLVAMGLIRTDNIRRLVVDYFTTSIGLLVFYLYYIFTFHKKSPYIGLGIGLIVTAALLIALMISRHHFGK
ncbi:hypothetical protein EBR96_01435, partial [bacterium]|nr:hypothetical protein [bacterium]